MSIFGIGSSVSGYSIGQMMSNMQTRDPSGSEKAKEKPDFTELVAELDADESGSLDTDAEIQSLAEAVGYDTGVSEELTEFFSTYDTDESGSISEDEAVAALEANAPQGPPPPPSGGPGGASFEEDFVSALESADEEALSEEDVQELVDFINGATGSEYTVSTFLDEYASDAETGLTAEDAVAAMEDNRPEQPEAQEATGMGASFEEDFVSALSLTDSGVLDEDSLTELADFLNEATGSAYDADSLLADYASSSDGLTAEDAVAAMEANRPEGGPPATENGPLNTVAVETYMNMISMSSLGTENTGTMMETMMGPFSGMA